MMAGERTTARSSKGADSLVGTLYAERFLIDSQIASGGMGVVYRARQVSMDRWVALKVLRGNVGADQPMAQWFSREMRAASRIQHPNTVRVYDFGRSDDGSLYLAMELLEGKTLEQEIRAARRLTPSRTIHIALQIAKALNAAHLEGVVHRDLKGENILLLDLYGERDFVKVVDFGIAMLQGYRAGELVPGMVAGTPEFMAPEQARAGAVDHRADLYALGVLLYQMVTGRTPFVDEDPARVLTRHLTEPPRPPSTLVPGGLPGSIEQVILALLAKTPDDRPASASVVLGMLGKCAAHPAVSRRTHARWLPEGGAPQPSPASDDSSELLGSEPSSARTVVSTPSQLGIPVVRSEPTAPGEAMPLGQRRGARLLASAVVAALLLAFGFISSREGREAAPQNEEAASAPGPGVPVVTGVRAPLGDPRSGESEVARPPSPLARGASACFGPEARPRRLLDERVVSVQEPPPRTRAHHHRRPRSKSKDDGSEAESARARALAPPAEHPPVVERWKPHGGGGR